MASGNGSQNSLHIRALPGTHELVVETALRYVPRGATVLDLGAGSGALTQRLVAAQFRVTSADIGNAFALSTPFVSVDCNDPNFDRLLPSQFDLIA